MRRLALIVIALLLAGGTAAWADAPAPPPSGVTVTPDTTISPYDTVVDYGQLVRISGTPEHCGLSQAPTRVKIEDNAWTKQMSPVIFCWASKTGKPVLGVQVAMIYLIKGKTVVALTNWQKRGKSFFLHPFLLKKVWTTVFNDRATDISLGLEEVPLSADQLAGKVRKKVSTMGGREIIPRQAPGFGCAVQIAPVLVWCERRGTWDEWSPSFWVGSPWRPQDVMVGLSNPACGCQWSVEYDPSGHSSQSASG